MKESELREAAWRGFHEIESGRFDDVPAHKLSEYLNSISDDEAGAASSDVPPDEAVPAR